MTSSNETPGAAPAESIPGAAFDIADLDRDIVLPRARKQKLPLLTALLALCATAGVGVVGGILIQKHWVGSSGGGGGGGGGNAAAFAAFRAQAAGGTGTAAGGAGTTGAGPGGGAGVAGGAGARGGGFAGTAGTIKAIDGSTLYVTDASGNVVQVTTAAGLSVRVAKDGTVADLKPGDTVLVQGTNTNGTVAATSISTGTAGGGLGRGGFGGGFGAGATGGAAPGDNSTGAPIQPPGGAATPAPSDAPPLPGLGG